MSSEWAEKSRKAAKEFVLQSLLFGSILFLALALFGRIANAGYMKDLFGLFLVCLVGLGPFTWAIVGLVRAAARW